MVLKQKNKAIKKLVELLEFLSVLKEKANPWIRVTITMKT